MNELAIVIFMSIAAALWALSSYSIGFKEGQRAGYHKGRSLSRQEFWQE